MSPPTFRFAPSPNGHLHLGHAFSALLNADRARASGGRLLLRIEDIDVLRCRPEFEAAIEADLSWLGMTWERPVRRQSQCFADYRDALNKLDTLGLLYPAFESRTEIAHRVEQRGADWPRDPDGAPLYPGAARDLSEAERRSRISDGAPYSLRLDMAAALRLLPALTFHEAGAGPDGQSGAIRACPQAWGDVILARKETPTSYHLSAVVDDARQGVTDVVRGQDLFAATSVHRLLQALLGLPEPCYRHHRLILDARGRKLSKSSQARSLRQYRADGASPADIRRMIGI